MCLKAEFREQHWNPVARLVSTSESKRSLGRQPFFFFFLIADHTQKFKNRFWNIGIKDHFGIYYHPLQNDSRVSIVNRDVLNKHEAFVAHMKTPIADVYRENLPPGNTYPSLLQSMQCQGVRSHKTSPRCTSFKMVVTGSYRSRRQEGSGGAGSALTFRLRRLCWNKPLIPRPPPLPPSPSPPSGFTRLAKLLDSSDRVISTSIQMKDTIFLNPEMNFPPSHTVHFLNSVRDSKAHVISSKPHGPDEGPHGLVKQITRATSLRRPFATVCPGVETRRVI